MEGREDEQEGLNMLTAQNLASYLSSGWPVALSSLLLLAIFVVSSFWLFHSRRRRAGRDHGGEASQVRVQRGSPALPPGSMGPLLLPLVGETLQFAFFNSCPIGCLSPFLASRLRRYGPVFKTHLIGRPMVVSLDPDFNKFLLSNEGKLVQVDYPDFIKKVVGPMLTTHGPRHRCIRELAFSILNAAAIQSSHIIPIQELAQSILGTWSDKPIVDAQHQYQKFIFSHMVRILISLEPDDPDTKMLMEDYPVLMYGYSAVPVDLPGFTYNKVLKARNRIIDILTRLVRYRRETVAQERKDFLGAIFKQKDESGEDLTDKDVVEFIFIMILGGFETTSILLTTVTKFLSENAHVVDELRKEHLQIRESKGPQEMLTWEDFKKMHFTELVIKETLRMATILHTVTREARHDVVYKDIIVPKGWTFLINFSMVHLNSDYYKNPLTFDPWRWKDVENNNQSVLMPFGGGIRSCVGSVLAKVEASMFLHYFLTTYKWERVTEGEGKLDVVSGLSFPTMKNGLLIKVEPLHKSSH